jgi:hypothetical protein
MFSFVCSSSTLTGCFGVPLLWLQTRLSAAMLAEVETILVECDMRVEGSVTSSIPKAVTRANYRVGVAGSVAVISLCLAIRVEAEITKCGVVQESAGVCFAGGSQSVCASGNPNWTRRQMELDKACTQGSKHKVKYRC